MNESQAKWLAWLSDDGWVQRRGLRKYEVVRPASEPGREDDAIMRTCVSIAKKRSIEAAQVWLALLFATVQDEEPEIVDKHAAYERRMIDACRAHGAAFDRPGGSC